MIARPLDCFAFDCWSSLMRDMVKGAPAIIVDIDRGDHSTLGVLTTCDVRCINVRISAPMVTMSEEEANHMAGLMIQRAALGMAPPSVWDILADDEPTKLKEAEARARIEAQGLLYHGFVEIEECRYAVPVPEQLGVYCTEASEVKPTMRSLAGLILLEPKAVFRIEG